MAAETAVVTEKKKLTSDRFASGKLKPKMDRGNDSPAPPPTNNRICYVCNATQPGDSFTILPDEKGIPRAIHVPTHAIGNKATDLNLGCRKGFEDRIAAAHRQEVRERQEDLALAALQRHQPRTRLDDIGSDTRAAIERIGGKLPKTDREIFDCTVTDCKRFFDNADDRDGHSDSHVLSCPDCDWTQGRKTKDRPMALAAHRRVKHPKEGQA